MEDLIKAIEITSSYNSMNFDDFIKKVEKWKKIKIPQKKIDDWKFIGLNNTDFILMMDEFLKV